MARREEVIEQAKQEMGRRVYATSQKTMYLVAVVATILSDHSPQTAQMTVK